MREINKKEIFVAVDLACGFLCHCLVDQAGVHLV